MARVRDSSRRSRPATRLRSPRCCSSTPTSTRPKPTARRRCTGPCGRTISELTDRLLRAGADVKAANRYGVTAIYLACVNGNAAIIEQLIKAGADANAAGREGETALMTAARTGHVDAAKVLLAHGAAVDAREEWHGQTALMWAAARRPRRHDPRARRARRRRQRAIRDAEMGTADHGGAARKMAAAGRHDAAAVSPAARAASSARRLWRRRRRRERRRSGRHQPR